jgi:putative redox protein
MKAELKVHAAHDGGMRVVASDGKFDVLMDYPLDEGESSAGPTPLTMLLASLAACSVNSVLVVLKKMRQPVAGVEVDASAVRSVEHPTVLTGISLEFTIKGDGMDPASIARALQLSEERLCPVWNMLKGGTPIKASFNLAREAAPAAV